LRLWRVFCSIDVPSPQAEVCARQPSLGGLIFGLIHLRSPGFVGVRINCLAQVADVDGIRRTVISSPENRKVGGLTPPLVGVCATACACAST
jgi:hypothetical protein